MDLTWWQFGLTTLTALTVGGILQWFLTLKFQKKKVKHEAEIIEHQAEKGEQEVNLSVQSVAAAQIQSAQNLVEMYKQGISDIKELSEQKEAILKEKLDKFEKLVNELKLSDERKAQVIESQSRQIKTLERLTNQLRLEMEAVKSQAVENCEFCKFKDECQKYLAKQQQ